MKLPLLHLLIISAFFIGCLSAFECPQSAYENFLKAQSRDVEVQKLNSNYNERFQTYCKSKEEIQTVNSQNLGYTLQEFRWMDRTDDQLKQLIKVQFTPEAIAATASQQVNSELRKVGAVNASVDYRTSNDVSPIKDQGSCGCCWSFTTVGLYQSWMMMKGENQYDLSEQYILECTTKYTKNVLKQNYASTCAGGYVDFAGDLARVNGIPLQTKYPYLGATFTGSGFPTTDGICDAKQTYLYAKDPTKTTFFVNRNLTSQQMKIVLMNGPVGALIYADSGFMSYSSGIYTGCGPVFSSSFSKINHAVVIVGYDSNGNYIIKNSWGTGWGVNGFGVVSRTNDCALSAYAFQYASNASPGTGLIYSNQVNLNHGYYLTKSVMLIVILGLIAMIL